MYHTQRMGMWYSGRMDDMSSKKQISVAVPADDYAMIKRAAFRREMTLAAFVRSTLMEAATYYAKEVPGAGPGAASVDR